MKIATRKRILYRTIIEGNSYETSLLSILIRACEHAGKGAIKENGREREDDNNPWSIRQSNWDEARDDEVPAGESAGKWVQYPLELIPWQCHQTDSIRMIATGANLYVYLDKNNSLVCDPRQTIFLSKKKKIFLNLNLDEIKRPKVLIKIFVIKITYLKKKR